MFRFLGLHTVFYRTHIDNSSFWTEVIYILYKYSINNNKIIIIIIIIYFSPCLTARINDVEFISSV